MTRSRDSVEIALVEKCVFPVSAPYPLSRHSFEEVRQSHFCISRYHREAACRALGCCGPEYVRSSPIPPPQTATAWCSPCPLQSV